MGAKPYYMPGHHQICSEGISLEVMNNKKVRFSKSLGQIGLILETLVEIHVQIGSYD